MIEKIQLYQNDIPDDLLLTGDIAVDTETMGLNFHRDRLCLLQMSNGLNETVLVKFDGYHYNSPNLQKLLSNKSKTIIFHYARFDLAVIKKYLNIEIENVFCTKIASKLVRTYTDSHGLKDLCRELLGLQISKQQQSSYWGSGLLSKEQISYAASDVLHLHKIKTILESMLIREGRMEIATKVFKSLNTRVELDLMGFEIIDIFAHH
jgi:ribonuclease D